MNESLTFWHEIMQINTYMGSVKHNERLIFRFNKDYFHVWTL